MAIEYLKISDRREYRNGRLFDHFTKKAQAPGTFDQMNAGGYVRSSVGFNPSKDQFDKALNRFEKLQRGADAENMQHVLDGITSAIIPGRVFSAIGRTVGAVGRAVGYAGRAAGGVTKTTSGITNATRGVASAGEE